jgi:hypothetical protein
MDSAVTRLERAMAADPDDDGVRVELARALTRAGRPLRALAVLPQAMSERDAIGCALAEALGLDWVGAAGMIDRFFDRSAVPFNLVLVPAGAFLDDGESGLASSLLERGARADLRRVVVPAFLAGLEQLPVMTDGAREAAALRGRLPSRLEWKKLWRGGLHLDGDLTEGILNPDPDRLLPQGEPPEPGVLARSPYEAQFDLDACEALERGQVGGIFDRTSCRYFTSIATPDERRGRRLVWRLVRDLPRELG